MEHLRILLLADTHLGIDLPRQPRVERRRRGDDFFANFHRVLDFALRSRPHVLVHGGDLFFRSRAPRTLVERAFAPLREVADAGIPVFVVPGNHERSAIPPSLLSPHPRIHLFDRPRTFFVELAGRRVALAGFPFHRHDVRGAFPELLRRTAWAGAPADVRLLCMHQTVEGASVGPSGYTFRFGPDVIRSADLPSGFDAFLAGHIHRHQVLREALSGRPLPAPVFYPGSIERTSFAERDEEKGFLLLHFPLGAPAEHSFEPLPARPMREVLLPGGVDDAAIRAELVRALARVERDAVVRIRLASLPARLPQALTAAGLRALAGPEMNVSLVVHQVR